MNTRRAEQSVLSILANSLKIMNSNMKSMLRSQGLLLKGLSRSTKIKDHLNPLSGKGVKIRRKLRITPRKILLATIEGKKSPLLQRKRSPPLNCHLQDRKRHSQPLRKNQSNLLQKLRARSSQREILGKKKVQLKMNLLPRRATGNHLNPPRKMFLKSI